MEKVLVVGLDGATFDIINKLVVEGRLPTIAKMMQKGAWGNLISTIPPVTPAAWTSFFTGKNPGKHGIYDFQEIDPTTYQFNIVRTDQHLEKTIWQLLGEAGHRSIIMDVPFTYPPRPLNGLMITGYGTPRKSDTIYTYPSNLFEMMPDDLRSEVRVALPNHRFDRSSQFIHEWEEIMNGRRRLYRYLITECEWDFFMAVFSNTDNMAHVFWTYVDPAHPNYHKPEAVEYRQAFYQAYEECDSLLGEMIEWAGSNTTTLVLSDHGFGSVRPRQYIFRRLLEGGYLHTKYPGIFTLFGDRLMKTAVQTYTNFPFLREWVKGLRPEGREKVKKTLRRSGLLPSGDIIDYTRSMIIPSNFGLRMWVNTWDQFSHGCVDPKKKNQILDNLSEYLLRDVDPLWDQPVIDSTYRGEDLYHGPNSDKGPDLVIEYKNYFQYTDDIHSANPYLEGGHTLEGIFLALGDEIQKGQFDRGSLIDIAPTILHLYEQPIPPDMDGKVLVNILKPSYLRSRPINLGETSARYEPGRAPASLGGSMTEEEKAEVEEQLRQLGYI